jgi:hypothetical protein
MLRDPVVDPAACERSEIRHFRTWQRELTGEHKDFTEQVPVWIAIRVSDRTWRDRLVYAYKPLVERQSAYRTGPQEYLSSAPCVLDGRVVLETDSAVIRESAETVSPTPPSFRPSAPGDAERIEPLYFKRHQGVLRVGLR